MVRGTILVSSDGGQTIRVASSFRSALHIWGIARARGRIWVGGDTKVGRPLLLTARRARGPWTRVIVPRKVVAVTAIATAGSSVWIATQQQSPRGIAATLLYSAGGKRPFRRVASVAPALGRPAYLRRIAISGDTVAVVGSDSVRGVLLVSRNRGLRFSRAHAAEVLHRGTGVAIRPSAIYVTGATGPPTDASRIRGTLLESDASGRRVRSRTFAGTLELADVTRSGQVLYVVGIERHGTLVATSRDDAHWRLARLPGQQIVVERLFGTTATFAVGSSGLFRVG
jgi:hypothetical protein